ncbi:hypothetical protein NESM_000594000 [Novymonas esmeraldas]|uniref:Uncharacterized protein n=1 Tax=Novymonas esmeraldas TaxID=1808958 RepID=A0AAW0EQR1_9TRYP
MLDKTELPFRRASHAALEIEGEPDGVPLLFSIAVEEAGESTTTTHSTDLHVPAAPMLKSVEVSSVTFSASAGSSLRRVCILAQRLDSDGRVTGPPVPLAVTDTAVATVLVRLKVFSGERVRLILLQHGAGSAVSEIILSGCIFDSDACFGGAATPLSAVLSWTPEPFRRLGEPAAQRARKRGRSPSLVGQLSDHLGEEEPPTLVYAHVIGGDDES